MPQRERALPAASRLARGGALDDVCGPPHRRQPIGALRGEGQSQPPPALHLSLRLETVPELCDGKGAP